MTLLTSFATEMILLLGAFMLLALDLIFLRKKSPESRAQFLGMIASIFIVVSALPLFIRFGETIHALGGMWVFDPLIFSAKVMILAITLLTVLISMEKAYTPHLSEYYALILFASLGMLFLVSSEELIMIYVALELLSVSLYILTALHDRVERSSEGALKYFLFGALSSSFLYYGASLLYGISGATNLSLLGEYLSRQTALGVPPIIWASSAFILVGFFFKIAVVPFHLWAPDAYEGAPTPITAFISTGSKLASFFILIKVLFFALHPLAGNPLQGSFGGGWEALLAIVAVLSMTFGNLVAMAQKNLKRLLAYSSIAHAGYLLVGIVTATRMGIAAVFYYLTTYAFTQLGAFGVIAAVSAKTGKDDLDDFSGMGKRSPLLSMFLVIFILSLAGIPPLGGFFGKFYLFLAAVGRDPKGYGLVWLVAAGVANSALSLYYYLKILKQMYILSPKESTPLKASPAMILALSLSAILVVGLGLFPSPLIHFLDSLLGYLPSNL